MILNIHTINHNVLSLLVKHNEYFITEPKGKSEFCFPEANMDIIFDLGGIVINILSFLSSGKKGPHSVFGRYNNGYNPSVIFTCVQLV